MSLLAAAFGFLVANQLVAAESVEAISRFANLDGNRVHYTDYGKGDSALLFVHGWNCDESVWNEQAPGLAKKIHVITIDLPGHGKSDQPRIAYTMDLHARAIDAVLQDAGAKDAVLVGHSNGTPVIRQFYRRFPEKVKGLVIVDGALRPFGDAATMEKFIAPMRGRDYETTVSHFVDNMVAPMKEPAQAEQVKKMMMSVPPHVAVSEMEGLRDPALWTEETIGVPVLMILAKQPAWTAEYEQFVRKLIPKVDYQTWEGVSHFIMMDKPREFKEALITFMTKNKFLSR